MANIKHSPTPWAFIQDDEDDLSSCSIVDANGDLVIAGEMNGWMTPFSCSEDFSKGNAIIAKVAPDLYRSLKDLLGEIEKVDDRAYWGVSDCTVNSATDLIKRIEDEYSGEKPQ